MKAGAAGPQLALDLFQVSQNDFAGFVAGANREALQALALWARGAGPRVIHVRGGPATGKTHLLQAAIGAVKAGAVPAMYVPLPMLLAQGEQVLDDLEQVELVALDAIDACVGHAAWERRLFTLYNALDAAGHRLLWSARSAPAFVLPDLASRVEASLIYQLHELAEDDKAQVLRSRAAERGLTLPEPVIEFVLRRERRDLGALLSVLDVLDQASLQAGRALTVPFVREILARRA